jgi:hypothetical protein
MNKFMMNEKIKHLLIDIAVVILVPGALFYVYVTYSGPSEPLFGSSQGGEDLVGEGQKFLAKLNELQKLRLDTSVFDTEAYRSLIDTHVTPPTEEAGREHPFIPVVQPSSRNAGGGTTKSGAPSPSKSTPAAGR